MSRTLWFVAGAGVGVYAMTRVRRVAASLTPEGLADRLSGLSLGLHLFTAEVRAGMAEKEDEVRERLAVTSSATRRQLPGPRATPIDETPGTTTITREANH